MERLEVSELVTSYLYMMQAGIYMVGLIFILFFPQVLEAGPRRLKFIASFLAFGAAGLLLGPAEFLNHTQVVLYRFISFALIGLF